MSIPRQQRFNQAADELLSSIRTLAHASQDDVQQARDAFGHHRSDASPEQVAELILRHSSEKLEGAMYAFDNAMESLGMPQPFAVYFKSRRLTNEGWQRLLDVLDVHSEQQR